MVVRNELEMGFYMPIYPIVIAAAAVFAVIFLTMYFAEKRISRENLLDSLKDENV